MHKYHLPREGQHGFSLIELLVVIIIVGVLAAIAIPQYTSYIQKSQRSDAWAALSQTQVLMERCYAQNFSYSAACTAMPTFPVTSPQGFYSVGISLQTATTYTLTATPTGTQAADTTCASISLNQANVKTATNTFCWNP